MPNQPNFDLNIGLSEEEKNDLEQMIGEFQKERSSDGSGDNFAAIQEQIDTMNERLAYLTSMFLTLDRRIQPFY